MNNNLLSIWNYEFVDQDYFWAFLLIPVFISLYIFFFRKGSESVKLSSHHKAKSISVFAVIKDVLFGLTMIGVAFLILAMARPQDPNKAKNFKENFTEGIDIMLAMDISASMNAEDFKKNRLDASIRMAKKFVDSRKDDNIGLVVYGGEAFMMSPLSNDHNNLKEKLDELSTDMVTPSTAIGDGLNLAAASIYKSKAKSKIVILLTDGVNNAGEVDPLNAAENAKKFDIKVYTIGIGTNGTAVLPIDMGGVIVRRQIPVEIDESLLQDIGERTGGTYFRATSEEKLEAIYEKIDELEKSPVKSYGLRIEPPEEFRWFAIPGLILIIIPIFMFTTFLRQIP